MIADGPFINKTRGLYIIIYYGGGVCVLTVGGRGDFYSWAQKGRLKSSIDRFYPIGEEGKGRSQSERKPHHLMKSFELGLWKFVEDRGKRWPPRPRLLPSYAHTHAHTPSTPPLPFTRSSSQVLRRFGADEQFSLLNRARAW